MRLSLSQIGLAALTLAVLSGCQPKASAPVAAALTEIDVAQVAQAPVQSWHTFTTHLEAPQDVALTPRVSGVIESIAFVEGQRVKEGELLFRLDPRPFAAQVARIKAQLASAQTAVEQAQNESQRASRLLARSAISTEMAESRAFTVRQRSAEVMALKAQLQAAQLDLEFTQIKAPISGIVSRAQITKGNNVIANQSVLTRIVSNDEMYAYFDVDERTWNQSFSQVTGKSGVSALLQLTGSEEFSHQGKLDFVDNRINETTGTLRVRASFKPQQGELRAGSFARVRVAASDIAPQILVPERAIGTDLKNRFVLTVNNKNVLEYRLVSVGDRYGAYRVISEGLNPGDRIAVNGPAKVGPGMPIAPRKVNLDLSQLPLTMNAPAAQSDLLTVKK